MPSRDAYILKSSADKRRHVCVDALNEKEILAFLGEDESRIKKFQYVVGLLLEGIRNTELYDKEEIDKATKNVTAMKLLKGGQNIRLYCKEQTDSQGTFYIIIAELLRKKKDQKVKGKTKTLIQTVGTYAYSIKERPEESKSQPELG